MSEKTKPLSSADKKQAQFLKREQDLLSVAEQIIGIEGFSGFTMDKLVAQSDYSKGTVYNHFCSKEDLLCALCIKSMETEMALFERAKTFEGNTRAKILAVAYAYRLHAINSPTLFLCVLTAKSPAIKEKASEERLARQQQLEAEMLTLCDAIFEQAIKDGDIPASACVDVGQLTFAAWSMAFGTNALLGSAAGLPSISRLDQDLAIVGNLNLLLDGMQWQPLSTELDYIQCWQQIGEQVFDQLSF